MYNRLVILSFTNKATYEVMNDILDLHRKKQDLDRNTTDQTQARMLRRFCCHLRKSGHTVYMYTQWTETLSPLL